jgi:hypothetical protein
MISLHRSLGWITAASLILAPFALHATPLVQSSAQLDITVPTSFVNDIGTHTWASQNTTTTDFSEHFSAAPYVGVSTSSSSSSGVTNVLTTAQVSAAPNTSGATTLSLNATSTISDFPLGQTGNISGHSIAYASPAPLFSTQSFTVAQDGVYHLTGTYTLSVATPTPPAGIYTFGEAFLGLGLTDSQFHTLSPALSNNLTEVNSDSFPLSTLKTTTQSFDLAYSLHANQVYHFDVNVQASALASTNGVPDTGCTLGLFILGLGAIAAARRKFVRR